jgi:hypothetical protein
VDVESECLVKEGEQAVGYDMAKRGGQEEVVGAEFGKRLGGLGRLVRVGSGGMRDMYFE